MSAASERAGRHPDQRPTPAGAPRLSVRGLRKAFGATLALGGVDLEVAPGEVCAVLGENGAGKSTLMKMLSGVERPDEGQMTLAGQPFAPRSPAEARAAGVAMVHQELSLCPHLTVEENILLGVEPRKYGLIDHRASRKLAAAALARVTARGDPIDPAAVVSTLGPAQRQLVEIARGMLGDCRLLILDEPTSSLAADDARRLFDLIATIAARGTAVLYVSHFFEEVRAVGHRYTVLRDGCTVGAGALADASDAQLVARMAGRPVEQLFVRSPRQPGEVVLAVEQLAGQSRPTSASLTLRRGEILGLSGLLGAGRTELLRAIFGLDAVKRGTVRVKSWSGAATPTERLSQGVGMLSEDRKGEGLALGLSLAENILLSSRKLFSLPRSRERAAARWLDELGVRHRDAGQLAGELSGGNQQKVALARLLEEDADVLLLDEPTRGIDVGSKAQIYARLDQLALQDKAILMVSSYLPELLGVCDRIAVMRRGVLLDARPVAECSEQSLLEQAAGASA